MKAEGVIERSVTGLQNARETTDQGMLLYKWPGFQVPTSLLHLSVFSVAISDFSFCQLLSNNNRNPEKAAYE